MPASTLVDNGGASSSGNRLASKMSPAANSGAAGWCSSAGTGAGTGWGAVAGVSGGPAEAPRGAASTPVRSGKHSQPRYGTHTPVLDPQKSVYRKSALRWIRMIAATVTTCSQMVGFSPLAGQRPLTTPRDPGRLGLWLGAGRAQPPADCARQSDRPGGTRAASVGGGLHRPASRRNAQPYVVRSVGPVVVLHGG